MKIENYKKRIADKKIEQLQRTLSNKEKTNEF